MSDLVLSIITPCYNEEEIAKETCEILLKFLNKLKENKIVSEKSYISIVDDGSTDNTWEILNKFANTEKNIKLIKLAYNTGHQNALFCGLVENQADIYITLDFDLQDDINIIPEMIEKYKNNNVDIVYTIRNNRDTDSLFKKVMTQGFYYFSKFIGVKQIPNSADFRLITDRVACFLRKSQESNIYLRGLLYDVGFHYDTIYFKREKRLSGEPKYTFPKLLELAVNGLCTSKNLVRLINIPAVIFLIISILKLNAVFFVGSINLFAIAILGEYITKIYTETKNRPNYMLSDKVNY